MYYYPIKSQDFENIKSSALAAQAAYKVANTARNAAQEQFNAGEISQADYQQAMEAHKAAINKAQANAMREVTAAAASVSAALVDVVDPADMDAADYRILSSGATLTAADLIAIKERNAGSKLIRQAVEKYAVDANFDPFPVELWNTDNSKDVRETLDAMQKMANAAIADTELSGSYGGMMLEGMDVSTYLKECGALK